MLTTPHASRWKKSDLAWLVLALAAHCVLLLLPLRHGQNGAEQVPAIAVQLVPYLKNADPQILPQPQPLPATKPPATVLPPSIREPDSPRTAAESTRANPVLPEESTITTGAESMSAARINDLVSRMSFKDLQTPAPPRQLGSPEHSKHEPSWRRGASATGPERTRFEGMMAPAEIELVDRWQAADGSQNVVLNTPGEETLCGRAEAWNPMNPLVEQVMMFRSCGGGGKRTFTMDKRELP